MSTILVAFGLLAVTFLVHLVWWRVRVPRRQTAMILLLFSAVLSIAIIAVSTIPDLERLSIEAGVVWFLVMQFQLGTGLAYACVNSALQHDSPALMVVTYVSLAGPKGCTRDDVRTILRDDVLIEPRIREFAAGGILELVDGRYRLTPRGLRFLQAMTFVRNFFRLPRGG